MTTDPAPTAPTDPATPATSTGPTALAWNPLLADQLTWHWTHQLRPRLEALTDEEYFFEPVPGCWSVRPRGTGDAPLQVGAGDHTIDFAIPEPDPAPVTTIAWRLGHLIVGIFAERNASHFAGPAGDYRSWTYAGTAAEALEQLDDGVRRWQAGVAGLGEEGLAAPCGPAEGAWAEAPMAALVLHVNREVLHHGAEICLLRDLFAARRVG